MNTITKYYKLRRNLRMTHKAATDISGVDWKAVGMCIYRMCIVALAWTALMAVLHTVDVLLDEREAHEGTKTRLIKLEHNVVDLLNERPAFINAEHTEWVACRGVESFDIKPYGEQRI